MKSTLVGARCWIGLGMILVFAPLMLADDTLTDRIYNSKEVYQELTNTPDKGVPDSLLKGCRCVAVIPHVVKAAFVVGGRHGRGIVSCRNAEGRWSPIAFLTVSGGSLGFQIGAQTTDLVLFIMSEKGAKSLLKSEFTIGADVSAAAGPVGRTASASTDIRLNADIYAYSRAKGLFAGISLEGASITPDEKAVREFYGAELSPETLLFRQEAPKVPEAAMAFIKILP